MKARADRFRSGFGWARVAPILAVFTACARAPSPPAPRLTRDPEMEAFESAVRLKNPAVVVVVSLANQYLAAKQNARGHETFCGLAAAAPERPAFAAFCGLFQARLAPEVPLLRRVAWVEDALAKLDRAAATDGLSRYLRGVVEAELPPRFGRAARAAEDLEWMLVHADSFPPGLRRGAYAGLASAYQRLGRTQAAREARARLGGGVDVTGTAGAVDVAGSAGAPAADAAVLSTPLSVDGRAGFRFSAPALVEAAPGIYVARGYDFADIAFVVTDAGVVAIDAGTSPSNARAALAAFRRVNAAPLRAVMVTHAHWDHVGGLSAFAGPGVPVIAQARFSEELARVNAGRPPWRFFFGDATPPRLDIHPDHLVAAPEIMTFGTTRFALAPMRGGETEDALLISLPDRGVTFVGDAFMPYFGAPFVAEGSVEGLLDAIAQVRALGPSLLIHGHPPLTESFPFATLAPLGEALRVTYDDTQAALIGGQTLAETLAHNVVPPSLALHPDVVFPFLLMRDNLVKRLFQQRSGYWKSDGEGLEVFSREAEGAALDLVAGGDEARLARAAATLADRGDLAMSLRITDLALAAHPRSAALVAVRARALQGLRVKHQFNPFKLIIYSELAGQSVSLPPPAPPGP